MDAKDIKSANEAEETKMVQEDLTQKIIGAFGRYQLALYIIFFILKIIVAFHFMAIIFLAPKVSYTCGMNGTETCPCSEPIYDTSVFPRTIIMEWNLICDRRWLVSVTQMLFQFGVLVGSMVFGTAADRLGRKTPLLVAVVAQILTGVAAAYSPSYWSFTFLRFLVGLTVGGTMVTSFVILMEYVGRRHRETFTALYQVPFNVGHMTISVFGYFFKDFSDFQLAISVIAVVMLIYFVVVMETPRWLVAVNKIDKAVDILERVAIINKRPTENIKAYVDVYQTKQNQLKKGNVLDLFRTPNLRKNIIAMSINWLACGYFFYGVSQYVGQLSGNLYFNVAFSGSINVVGTLLALPLIKIVGRRTILIVFHFISAACLCVLAVVTEGVGSVALATIGTVASSIIYMLSYLYCVELFPTVVRNAAIGFCSMISRIGSMVAPFVIDLQSVAPWLPPIAFAMLPFVAACVGFLLPETKGCELMNTLEEAEQFEKKMNNQK